MNKHNPLFAPVALTLVVLVVLGLSARCRTAELTADETAAEMAMSLSLSNQPALPPKVAVKEIAPKLQSPAPALKFHGADEHSHKCSRCGHEFWHTDASFGNAEAHRCPACGWGPNWQQYRRGSSPARAVYPSPNVMPRIRVGLSVNPFANCPTGT